MKKIIVILSILSMSLTVMAGKWPGKKSEWNGGARYDFKLAGREAIVVEPANPLSGNPWIWCPAFFDAFPSIDIELLQRGFHIVYYDLTNEWGRPSALQAGEKFHEFVTSHGLMDKAVMEGLSRGGYYSLRFAETRPDKVAALLLDNPLVDLNELRRNKEWWDDVIAKWNEDSIATPPEEQNAKNCMGAIVDNRIPVLLLSGGEDDIVPYENNGRIVKEICTRWGSPMKSYVRPGGGHHPHGLDNPAPAANYIIDCIYGKEKRPAKVACIGDSMTEGVGTDDYSTQSYPAQLQQILGDGFAVTNFGVSCSTMSSKGTDNGKPFGYSGLPAMQRALDWSPDIVIIALGANDSKDYNWERLSGEFEADCQSIVNAFATLPSMPEIFLVIEPNIPYNAMTNSWGFRHQEYYDEMCSKIRNIAHANRIKIIDMRNVFEGERTGCYAPNAHPNPRGAALMARAVGSVVMGGATASAMKRKIKHQQ